MFKFLAYVGFQGGQHVQGYSNKCWKHASKDNYEQHRCCIYLFPHMTRGWENRMPIQNSSVLYSLIVFPHGSWLGEEYPHKGVLHIGVITWLGSRRKGCPHKSCLCCTLHCSSSWLLAGRGLPTYRSGAHLFIYMARGWKKRMHPQKSRAL